MLKNFKSNNITTKTLDRTLTMRAFYFDFLLARRKILIDIDRRWINTTARDDDMMLEEFVFWYFFTSRSSNTNDATLTAISFKNNDGLLRKGTLARTAAILGAVVVTGEFLVTEERTRCWMGEVERRRRRRIFCC